MKHRISNFTANLVQFGMIAILLLCVLVPGFIQLFDSSTWLGYRLMTIAIPAFLLYILIDGGLFGSYVTAYLTPETIVFRKPWKKYARLFKKGTAHFELTADMWTECYLFSHKDAGLLYFRKNKETVFVIRIDGIGKFFRKIERFYQESHRFIDGNSESNKHETPKNAIKRLRKAFPERCM